MNILNWNWKAIGIVSLILIAVIGGLSALHFYDLLQAEKQKGNLLSASKIDFKVQPTKVYKDSAGKSHFQAPAKQNTFNQSTIDQNPNVSLGGADTAALAANIQRKQIEQWQQIASTSEARELKAETRLDSMKNVVRYYKSKYIELAYHEPLSKDDTDNGTFDYKKFEQLNVLQFWKRTHLIGPRTSFLDISSTDPNTIITGYNALAVQPDPNPFTLRGQAKTTFDFASGRFIPSAGVIGTYRNWEISYKYYYSHSFQRLEPLVSAAYNLWLR